MSPLGTIAHSTTYAGMKSVLTWICTACSTHVHIRLVEVLEVLGTFLWKVHCPLATGTHNWRNQELRSKEIFVCHLIRLQVIRYLQEECAYQRNPIFRGPILIRFDVGKERVMLLRCLFHHLHQMLRVRRVIRRMICAQHQLVHGTE
jgi:hypothetical protein